MKKNKELSDYSNMRLQEEAHKFEESEKRDAQEHRQNLENLETDVARKIFDFLSGATYALNGNVQKIANNIFLFAPANVDITYNPTQKSSVSDSPVRSPWK